MKKVLLPKLFFRILNKAFRKQKYKDTILQKYLQYVTNVVGMKIFFADEVAALSKEFPDKVLIQGASVYFKNVYLFKNGIIQISENVYYVRDFYWYYVFLYDLKNYSKTTGRAKRIEVATMLCGSYSSSFNIFHFFIDSIIANFSFSVKAGELFIVNDVKNEFQREVLSRLDVESFVEISNGPFFCETLKLGCFAGKWNRTQIQLFRDRVNPYVCESEKILYITRSLDKRGFINEREVCHFLASRGVEVVDFSVMSLDERCELLSRAKILIGQYGAGMSNMIFMPPGSYILEIQLGSWVKEDYCTLANLCEHKYLFLPLPVKLFSNEKKFLFTSDDFYKLGQLLQIAKDSVDVGK